MSKLSHTRSVRLTYPGFVLVLDYGLHERTIQSICHGLDQLFSIVTTYSGIQRVSMFGLIISGQSHSEVFLPLSLTQNIHIELQLALYKLQLVAQKWSMKSNQFNTSTISLQSALQLAYIEINSAILKNNENPITRSFSKNDFQTVVLTNRLSDSILRDIHQFIENHNYDNKRIELVFITDENNIESSKHNVSSLDSINVRYVLENQYSISLYFKSWLLSNDQDHEHVQLYIPSSTKDKTLLSRFFSSFYHLTSSSSSPSMAVRRLQQDFRQLIKNKVDGIDASPSPDNLFLWNAIICGPEESLYESGTFQLQLLFPDDYPMRPPQVRFITKVFHPNVWWEDGFICVDILKDGWLPSYDVLAILHSIRLLLVDPNPQSPANLEAALLYRDNRLEYNRRVFQTIQDTIDADDNEDDDDGDDHKIQDDDQVEDSDTLRQKTTVLPESVNE